MAFDLSTINSRLPTPLPTPIPVATEFKQIPCKEFNIYKESYTQCLATFHRPDICNMEYNNYITCLIAK